jgi:hypothetical protein
MIKQGNEAKQCNAIMHAQDLRGKRERLRDTLYPKMQSI